MREHLEKLIDDVSRHFEAMIRALTVRVDDLRAADKTALDAAFASSDKAISTAFASQGAAVTVALQANEKRLDGLNELRRDVAMVADVKAVKDTAVVEFRGLNEKMGDLKSRLDKLEARGDGRAGGLRDYIGWIIAALTIASSVIGFALLLRK